MPDCKFTHHGGMKDGNRYMVEWTMSGTAFDIEFACRGASVGETDDEGRIVHNRDYWDSRSFPMMPGGPENPSLEELQAEHSSHSPTGGRQPWCLKSSSRPTVTSRRHYR